MRTDNLTADEFDALYEHLYRLRESLIQEAGTNPGLMDGRTINALAACNILLDYAAGNCADDLEG